MLNQSLSSNTAADRGFGRTRDSGAIRHSRPHDHADIDKLWATWQGMAGHQDRIEPVRGAHDAPKPALDVRMRALLGLVAAGDQGAYEELYRLLSGSVHAFVRRMISNVDTADEVVVDTMYEVWRTADRYRGEPRVTTWVLGIARNKALMAIRGNAQARCEDIEDFADSLDSGVPDGFALLAQKRARELIRTCLRQLSEQHRECIHLAHFEELSIGEIAAMLGIPEGTVKSRAFEARAQLAKRVSAMLRRAGPH